MPLQDAAFIPFLFICGTFKTDVSDESIKMMRCNITFMIHVLRSIPTLQSVAVYNLGCNVMNKSAASKCSQSELLGEELQATDRHPALQ